MQAIHAILPTNRQYSDTSTLAGDALRYARSKQGVSGEALASLTGLSRRTLVKIEQGDDSVAFRSYRKVAEALNLTTFLEAYADTSVTAALQTPQHYLSGATALSIPGPNGEAPALWYSGSLRNPKTWKVAGNNLTSTSSLLGVTGLWDATKIIARYGVHLPRIWAASPERAVFDLLIHHGEINRKQVPNVQMSDVDDVVCIEKVREWVVQCKPFLSEQGCQVMLAWLKDSD